MLKIIIMHSFSQGCGLDGCRVEVGQAWWLLPGCALAPVARTGQLGGSARRTWRAAGRGPGAAVLHSRSCLARRPGLARGAAARPEGQP